MKLALVCPHFPPDRCGVGDYTALLSEELTSLGHTVQVWTGQAAPKHYSEFKVRTHPGVWGLGDYLRIQREIAAFRPDAVLIQFTPYLFAPNTWGVRPTLPGWILSLRSKLKVPVVLAVHELHYPLGLTPDRMIVGGAQAAQFMALAAAASQVWFSYEIPLLRYRSWMPWKSSQFSWIPVGANVDPEMIQRPIQEKEYSEAFRLAKVPERHHILVQFGSSHPSRLFPHSFLALDQARKEFGPDSTSLLFLGLDQTAVDQALEAAGRMDLRGFVRGTGYVQAWQASVWLKNADLVLAPFVDGVSTRRGSVMAALAHGTPVVTTSGIHTDPSLNWDEFTSIAPAENASAFAESVVRLLRNPGDAKAIGEAGRMKYNALFSWKAIAEQILKQLSTLPVEARSAPQR